MGARSVTRGRATGARAVGGLTLARIALRRGNGDSQRRTRFALHAARQDRLLGGANASQCERPGSELGRGRAKLVRSMDSEGYLRGHQSRNPYPPAPCDTLKEGDAAKPNALRRAKDNSDSYAPPTGQLGPPWRGVNAGLPGYAANAQPGQTRARPLHPHPGQSSARSAPARVREDLSCSTRAARSRSGRTAASIRHDHRSDTRRLPAPASNALFGCCQVARVSCARRCSTFGIPIRASDTQGRTKPAAPRRFRTCDGCLRGSVEGAWAPKTNRSIQGYARDLPLCLVRTIERTPACGECSVCRRDRFLVADIQNGGSDRCSEGHRSDQHSRYAHDLS